ncbi:hypothetical protein P8452_02426 [Trifolium repens]|nr:hypothetical protein P8452_02426 [Trifolium repens]
MLLTLLFSAMFQETQRTSMCQSDIFRGQNNCFGISCRKAISCSLAVDKNAELLQQSQLEATASSSEIRDALNDKTLQELIFRIDCSPNAENELDKAMADEAFHLFTDKILSTINP